MAHDFHTMQTKSGRVFTPLNSYDVVDVIREEVGDEVADEVKGWLEEDTYEEKKFNSSFAPFVKPANVTQIAELLEEASRQIERNGYAPIIFLDTSFKMTKLLRMK